MNEYRVTALDQLQPTLAGHDGLTYQSPSEPREHALALAGAFVRLAELRDQHGPTRHTRPGGTHAVRIEAAP